MTVYKTRASEYYDIDTGALFNPNDIKYRIIDQRRIELSNECKGDVKVYVWHFYCKTYGTKESQLTFNF